MKTKIATATDLVRHPLSQRFHDLLVEIGKLHDTKQLDYGKDKDPFDNMNAAREWSVEPWVMAMMRADEKLRRLKTMASKGRLANESAFDSFNDIAVLALIGRVLFENRPLMCANVGDYFKDYANFSDLVECTKIDHETNEVTHERKAKRSKRGYRRATQARR